MGGPDARAAPGTNRTFRGGDAATGLSGAFAFHFLPDGRIIVSERPGRIRIVGKDGTPSAPLGGLPAGVGIDSVDWPQPQQLDSNMGKVLRCARGPMAPCTS